MVHARAPRPHLQGELQQAIAKIIAQPNLSLARTAFVPRSIALFAAVPTQPPAGSLPPMLTGHRGTPFLSVTTHAQKTIYDNGFLGVYAICPRTVAGAAYSASARCRP